MSWVRDLAGGVLEGALGYAGMEATNSANRAMAREQMAFQKKMSDTSYQRAVADLNAAGLNPMLAYGQGGASTPPGATAQMQNSSAAGIEAQNRRMERLAIESNIELNQAKVGTEKANQALISEQAREKRWENHTNMGPTGADEAIPSLMPIEGPKSLTALSFQLKKLKEEPGLIRAQSGLAAANMQQSLESIDKMVQDIAVGKATEQQIRANTEHIKVLIENSKLDQSQKKAMAAAWDELGAAGGLAKEAIPFLKILITILGK